MANSMDNMRIQAEAYLNQGKPLEAIAIYEQIIKLDPNYAPAYSDLGRVLESQGWQELAIVQYIKALSLAPSSYSPASHLSLGMLLKNRGQITEAIACFQKAIGLNPSYKPAYQAWVETLIEQQKLDQAWEVYAQAELFDLDLINSKDFNDLGIAYINQNQLDQAIACFQKAISIEPSYASAHCNLGNALLQHGSFKEAIISFNEALSIDPNFAEVYYNLAIALNRINRLDEAIACFEAAISLKPEFREAHTNLNSNLGKALGIISNPQDIGVPRYAPQLD